MLSRMEHDSIGALNVPAEAYYGVQSMRAATNFQITHRPLHPVLIDSIVTVSYTHLDVYKRQDYHKGRCRQS